VERYCGQQPASVEREAGPVLDGAIRGERDDGDPVGNKWSGRMVMTRSPTTRDAADRSGCSNVRRILADPGLGIPVADDLSSGSPDPRPKPIRQTMSGPIPE
jgi:hypothetical protein